MLLPTVARGYASLFGLIFGARVDLVTVVPPAGLNAPQTAAALAGGQVDSLAIAWTGQPGRGLLPLGSFTLEGEALEFGWKAPALTLAPLWLIFARQAIPYLAVILLVLPAGPRSGNLAFDALVPQEALNRGAWPSILSSVLSTITRSSLPAMLMGNADAAAGLPSETALPSSTCTGASIEADCLVLEGRVQLTNAELESEELAYTMRTRMRAERDTIAPGRSALLWHDPELKLSLGDTGLRGLLPKWWVPVLSATGVVLPPGIDLRRVSASDAAGGVVASGVLTLGADAGDETRGGGAMVLT